jgi:predicted nucleic acid-binding protein
VKGIIESKKVLFTPVLSLFEIKRKLLGEGHRGEAIKKVLGFVKERSIIVDLSETLAEKAAELSAEIKLHTIDSIIYKGALESKATLITADSDFEGLGNVRMCN